MIWFFLAGFISGAVGMVLFARWWVLKHNGCKNSQRRKGE